MLIVSTDSKYCSQKSWCRPLHSTRLSLVCCSLRVRGDCEGDHPRSAEAGGGSAAAAQHGKTAAVATFTAKALCDLEAESRLQRAAAEREQWAQALPRQHAHWGVCQSNETAPSSD